MIDHAPKMGQLIYDTPERDAVHFALFPAEAAQELHPGRPVGLSGLQYGDVHRVVCVAREQAVGIVDPFLGRIVQPGERCWIMLYPNTITDLKHVWTHPKVPILVPVEAEAEDVDDDFYRCNC
jgi:hypothetical protein